MTTPDERLVRILPTPPAPARPDSPIQGVLLDGDIAYVSGVVAFHGSERPAPGKVGREITVADARIQAGLAAANGLHRLAAAIGSLENVEQMLKLTVFVNATEDLVEQPEVAHGASDVLLEVLGARGRHARSAIGCASLPLGAPVEVEMIARVRP